MKKTEYGRSMIEMLGVLAVIGVLSIAGLQAYRIAMAKFRTNNVLEAVSLINFDQQAGVVPDAKSMYGITVEPDQGDTVCVNVTGTASTKAVCENLRNSLSEKFVVVGNCE